MVYLWKVGGVMGITDKGYVFGIKEEYQHIFQGKGKEETTESQKKLEERKEEQKDSSHT